MLSSPNRFHGDAVRTAIVTYRFERGNVVHRDGDYHIGKAA